MKALYGERQVAPDINGIRADHRGRYKFACNYVKDGTKILDVGCGIGYGSHILSTHTDAKEIVAIDKEKEAIKYAKQYYRDEKIVYMRGDCLRLKLQSNYYDLVAAFEILEHIKHDCLFVKRLRDVLNEHGLLIISSPDQDKMPFNKNRFPFHIRHYKHFELEYLICRGGFKVIGKFCQNDLHSEETLKGYGGLFNILVAVKG